MRLMDHMARRIIIIIVLIFMMQSVGYCEEAMIEDRGDATIRREEIIGWWAESVLIGEYQGESNSFYQDGTYQYEFHKYKIEPFWMDGKWEIVDNELIITILSKIGIEPDADPRVYEGEGTLRNMDGWIINELSDPIRITYTVDDLGFDYSEPLENYSDQLRIYRTMNFGEKLYYKVANYPKIKDVFAPEDAHLIGEWGNSVEERIFYPDGSYEVNYLETESSEAHSMKGTWLLKDRHLEVTLMDCQQQIGQKL